MKKLLEIKNDNNDSSLKNQHNKLFLSLMQKKDRLKKLEELNQIKNDN